MNSRPILSLLVLAAAAASGDAMQTGAERRIALFIGIDRYPRIEEGDLAGCANDARALRALFRDRFGFDEETLLLDEQATRAGIGAAFEELHARVQTASEADARVTALVVYAGHGSRVADQPAGAPGHDEEEGLDETWVAHDSTWSGEADVRDDELEALLAGLAELEAEVLLVSDSCHSGTIHRGADFARTRTLRRPAGAPETRPGPEGWLLAPPEPAGTRGGGAAGFVSLTACADHERASEHRDEQGLACGRFSFALRRALLELPPGSSFADLHRRVAAEFAKHWPDRSQTPQLHASAAKAGEVFLLGGYPPSHAALAPGSPSGGVARLTNGHLHGVEPGLRFELYPDLSALAARAGALGGGTVLEVELDSCLVRLDEGCDPAPTAVARLDAVRIGDLSISLDPDLSAPILARLRALEEQGRLVLAQPGEQYGVAVHALAAGSRIGLFGPAALPSRDGQADAPDPEPFWETSGSDPDAAAECLCARLEQLSAAQRLLALSRDEGSVEIALEPRRSTPQGPEPAELRTVGGVPRLAEGERVALRFRNHTRRRLFVHVLVLSASEVSGLRAEILHPPPEQEPRAVEPHSDLELVNFRATADSALERTTLKLIAAAEPLELHPLLPGSETRGAGDRGGDTPRARVLALIDSALNGGAPARGLVSDPGALYWTTAELVFDVERALPPAPADQ